MVIGRRTGVSAVCLLRLSSITCSDLARLVPEEFGAGRQFHNLFHRDRGRLDQGIGQFYTVGFGHLQIDDQLTVFTAMALAWFKCASSSLCRAQIT